MKSHGKRVSLNQITNSERAGVRICRGNGIAKVSRKRECLLELFTYQCHSSGYIASANADISNRCRIQLSCVNGHYRVSSADGELSCKLLFDYLDPSSKLSIPSHLSWRTLFSATTFDPVPQSPQPRSMRRPLPRMSHRRATSCRSSWWCTLQLRLQESPLTQLTPETNFLDYISEQF